MNIKERQKGVWQLTWESGRDGQGHRLRRRETVHGNKHLAEKRWREVQQQIETGTDIPPTGETTADWLRYWLAEIKSPHVRQSTRESYATLTTRYLIPVLGTIPLPKLRSDHIQAAVTQWSTQPKVNGQAGLLSARTVNYALALLTMALETAVEFRRISHNPAAVVKGPKRTKKPPVWWSATEAQHFIEATQRERYWIAWTLALLTGLRQGEILGLRWRDVDWGPATLTVRQIRHSRGHRYDVPKTERGARPIALDEATLTVLRVHRKRQLAERLKAGAQYDDEDLVVATQLGHPVSARNLTRSYYRARDAAGVPVMPFHDLRHTHASLLVEGGANARVVADRLGHSQVSFTMQTYVHARVDGQRKDAEVLSNKLLGGVTNERGH